MKLNRASVLAFFCLTTMAAQAAAQAKIAVVDLQRALLETEDGRAAKEKLRKLFQERQQTLDKKQTELKDMKDGIEKQRKVLSREALGAKLEEYQKAMLQVQQAYMDYQRELAGKESEMTEPVMRRMQEIVKRLGQKEGYSLILDKTEGGVVFVPGNLDLTDLLIQRYNAGEGKTAAPAESDPKPKKK